jgi:hypothetical protein
MDGKIERRVCIKLGKSSIGNFKMLPESFGELSANRAAGQVSFEDD